MYKKVKNGIEIDSAKSDESHYPRMPVKKDISRAEKELKKNPPEILEHTAKKFGRKKARKQKIAIMLNKARKGK